MWRVRLLLLRLRGSVDVTFGYKLPNTSVTLQVVVNNVFDTAYPSFVGVPEAGRFGMVRLRYDLF